MATIQMTRDGDRDVYSFAIGRADFTVRVSEIGWHVYRAPRGAQLNHVGKFFWSAADAAAHYKKAGDTLRDIETLRKFALAA